MHTVTFDRDLIKRCLNDEAYKVTRLPTYQLFD